MKKNKHFVIQLFIISFMLIIHYSKVHAESDNEKKENIEYLVFTILSDKTSDSERLSLFKSLKPYLNENSDQFEENKSDGNEIDTNFGDEKTIEEFLTRRSLENALTHANLKDSYIKKNNNPTGVDEQELIIKGFIHFLEFLKQQNLESFNNGIARVKFFFNCKINETQFIQINSVKKMMDSHCQNLSELNDKFSAFRNIFQITEKGLVSTQSLKRSKENNSIQYIDSSKISLKTILEQCDLLSILKKEDIVPKDYNYKKKTRQVYLSLNGKRLENSNCENIYFSTNILKDKICLKVGGITTINEQNYFPFTPKLFSELLSNMGMTNQVETIFCK